ncbi:SDR family oxidoreductase [Candidatus Palauibacter sp.]|uniref:SDR family oxidoreductase n=1 Tax=Candidatus Palauibacter sp. TaxID=3101350 RepID=UPI003D12F242
MSEVSAHQGRRVIVTGAGAGIGRAIASALLGEGARVHVCDRDAGALEDFLGSAEGDLAGTVADVGVEADVERLFAEGLARLGGLDVLVNNAGTAGPTGPVETLDLDGWRQTLAVNLDGMFLCARAAVPALRRAGGGSIVNLSSTAGLHGYPLRSPYATAKWGVIGFTRTLAMELGPAGIRVNAICPGSVRGDRIDRVIAAQAATRGVSEEAVRQNWLRQISLRRFADAEDVAALVLFLTSDAGAKISGQALPVDGHTEGLSSSVDASSDPRGE